MNNTVRYEYYKEDIEGKAWEWIYLVKVHWINLQRQFDEYETNLDGLLQVVLLRRVWLMKRFARDKEIEYLKELV